MNSSDNVYAKRRIVADGGLFFMSIPYVVESDCYSKIRVDKTYWDGTSEKSRLENYPSSANTNAKRFVEFILNEYCRESNEEEMYYEIFHHSGLQAERIQHAQRLLERGTLSIERVAEQTGFGSAESFRLQFRQSVGVSPSQWRKTFATA